MQVILESDVDGTIYIRDAEEQKTYAKLPAAAMMLLGFFDEERSGFSWEGDAERVAEMLRWQLEDQSYEIRTPSQFRRAVSRLVTPGPPFDPADYIIRIDFV